MVLALAVFLVVLTLAAYAVVIFNRLVARRAAFRNAFAQIEVQLKRRYDLIPNLVETAKRYLSHERETLAARDVAGQALRAAQKDPAAAQALRSLFGADSALGAALGRLLAVAEGYPDLKANQTMGQLMEELRSTENKVAFARQAYNDSVMSYNIEIESFPQTLVAGIGGFPPAASWVIEDKAERLPVRVSF
jgi:LemA protein